MMKTSNLDANLVGPICWDTGEMPSVGSSLFHVILKQALMYFTAQSLCDVTAQALNFSISKSWQRRQREGLGLGCLGRIVMKNFLKAAFQLSVFHSTYTHVKV